MATAATTRLPALVWSHYSPSKVCNSNKLSVSRRKDLAERRYSGSFSYKAVDRAAVVVATRLRGIRCSSKPAEEAEENGLVRAVLRLALWTMEAVYILWLFLLPYAPGDPVWAISSETINSLIALSLNFFFILPLSNAVAGIHLLDAPIMHPISEGLFNFVIAWTLLFAPLLYTDQKRDRYKGSLDVLWGLQMFLTNMFERPNTNGFHKDDGVGISVSDSICTYYLTLLHYFLTKWTKTVGEVVQYHSIISLVINKALLVICSPVSTFLIPYMAIRMNDSEPNQSPRETSKLGSLMINGSQTVALAGGAVCILSLFWSFFGRTDGDFGSISDRWRFLTSYLGSERLAYAFIWDILLYTIFQPWLIGDNLQNVRETMVVTVNYLRFIPVVGLIAYLLFLDEDKCNSL